MATVRVGEFEWDDAKARVNRRKHGVTFEEAMTVFLDELAMPLQEHQDHQRKACNKARAESICRGRLNHPSGRFGTSPRSTSRV